MSRVSWVGMTHYTSLSTVAVEEKNEGMRTKAGVGFCLQRIHTSVR